MESQPATASPPEPTPTRLTWQEIVFSVAKTAGVLCAPILAAWGGWGAALLVVTGLGVLELVGPRIERVAAHYGAHRVATVQRNLRAMWAAAFLVSVVWVWSVYVSIAVLFGLLFLWFLALFWIPLLFVTIVTVREGERDAFRFALFGTLEGNPTSFLCLPDGRLLIAIPEEFGWTRHVVDASQEVRWRLCYFTDVVLIGCYPPVRDDLFDLEPGCVHKTEADEALAKRLLTHDASAGVEANFAASVHEFLGRTRARGGAEKANRARPDL